MVLTFQVATACFSCSPAILNSSKLSPVVDDVDLIVFQIIDKAIRNSKFRYLSEATPITITSSLSHYSYQKDKWT
jgi:hypothetical protein